MGGDVGRRLRDDDRFGSALGERVCQLFEAAPATAAPRMHVADAACAVPPRAASTMKCDERLMYSVM